MSKETDSGRTPDVENIHDIVIGGRMWVNAWSILESLQGRSWPYYYY